MDVDILVVRLAGPGANDSDLDALTYFPELEYLELVNTNVTEAGLARFRKALPECEIIRE